MNLIDLIVQHFEVMLQEIPKYEVGEPFSWSNKDKNCKKL